MASEISFSLRPMTPADANAVQQLWHRRFGGDPATQEKWIEAALDPDHTATVTITTPSQQDSLVGFGVLEIGGKSYARRYLSLDALGLDPPLAPRNGLFHMYCVDSTWEGRGIGAALYAHHIDQLAARGVARGFGIAWHRSLSVDSRVLFEKHEFTRLTTVERYYAHFEERSHCPDCEGACTCTASLYTRTIESR